MKVPTTLFISLLAACRAQRFGALFSEADTPVLFDSRQLAEVESGSEYESGSQDLGSGELSPPPPSPTAPPGAPGAISYVRYGAFVTLAAADPIGAGTQVAMARGLADTVGITSDKVSITTTSDSLNQRTILQVKIIASSRALARAAADTLSADLASPSAASVFFSKFVAGVQIVLATPIVLISESVVGYRPPPTSPALPPVASHPISKPPPPPALQESPPPSPPFFPIPTACNTGCDEVSFLIAGTVETFDEISFLIKLAKISNTSSTNLFIKSIRSASIAVTVGLLPGAAKAIKVVVSSTSVQSLSDALNVTVLSTPSIYELSAPPNAPGRGIGEENNTLAFAIYGGIIVSLFAIALVLFIFLKCCTLTEQNTPFLEVERKEDEKPTTFSMSDHLPFDSQSMSMSASTCDPESESSYRTQRTAASITSYAGASYTAHV